MIVFLLSLLVYLWSAPRTVVLEDDGLFILAAYYNGIAHPPGYPFYTLLSHLASLLPIGTVAYRVHVLSGLFGALGCLSLWWLIRCWVPARISATTASLAFGFSQVYWSQAIIAEVYTLNVLLIILLFVLANKYVEQDDTGSVRVLCWLSLLYGLSLSNHWPLLVLSTPALLLLMWPRRRRLLQQLPYCLPMLLLGLLPYVWMVWRSQMDPQISFYGPIESWSEFWFVVSREGYAAMDNSPSAGLEDKWQYMGFVLRESATQLGFIGGVLALVGFLGQWRVWPGRVSLSLTTAYLCNTILLIGLLGFDYELFHRNIFRVYPLIAYAMLAIWMGLGMYLLAIWLQKKGQQYVPGSFFTIAIAALLIMLVMLSNIKVNYRANDNWADTYAKSILTNLAPGAAFFASSDSIVATIGYLNLIENVAPDISVYQTHGLIFSNRLFRSDRNTEDERLERIDKFILDRQKPVYYIRNFPHQYGEELRGLYKRVKRDASGSSQYYVFESQVIASIERILLPGEPIDAWQKMSYRHLNRDFCYFLAGLEKFNRAPDKKAYFQDSYAGYCRSYHGYLGLIRQLLSSEEIAGSIVSDHIDKAMKLRHQAITKEELVELDNYYAILLMQEGEYQKAEGVLRAAITSWPNPNNDAHKLLRELSIATQAQ